MFFPTASIECNPLIPPLTAFFISALTSVGGVSGAFLLLPFQMSFLGYTHPSVSATNQFFNIVATPSGIWRFFREGRLVWPLALAVAVGTLPGVFAGALIRIHCLPDPKTFSIFVGFVLLYIGGRMACDLFKTNKSKTLPLYSPIQKSTYTTWQLTTPSNSAAHNNIHTKANPYPQVQLLSWSLHKVCYKYNGEEYSFHTQGILALTFIVGIIGGTYGIGGGAIISPFLVSFFGLPIHTVAGASLLGTFLTSAAAVLFYMFIAPWYPHMSIWPDFSLGLLLGLGGMAGIYCGARLQKHIPARAIKILLVLILIATALRYLRNLFA